MFHTAQQPRRDEAAGSPAAAPASHHGALAHWFVDAAHWLASPAPRDQPG